MEGATPGFLALVRHRAGGGGARQNPPPPLPVSGSLPPQWSLAGRPSSAAEVRADQPAGPVSPQAAGPAVPERGIGPGGVSGCSGMPESEKVQPARQSSRIQGGQDTVERFPVASRAIEVSVMGEGEGSGGGDGGARGALSPIGGSKGPEPLASPSVIHWVGWLPFTTRCGTGPAVPRLARPSSAAEVRAVQPTGPALDSRRPGSRPSHP